MTILKHRLSLFTVAPAIFLAIYTIFLSLGLIQLNKLIPIEGEFISASASYRKTLGWQTYRPPHWELDVMYTYQFDGVLYDGSRLRIDGNGTVFESIAAKKANELVSSHLHGNNRITVWIDPVHPKFAVLEPRIGLLAWLSWLLIFAVILIIHHFSPRVPTKDIS